MSIIIVTVVHGIHLYRDDFLAPPCLFLVQKTRKQERKTCSIYILIARGIQQRNTGGRQMSRQNHSTNMTAITFLTQHKIKTATTIEISRQHLKISDNKTRER